MSQDRLRLAIQSSGRLSEGSLELLKRIGVRFNRSRKKLYSSSTNFPLDVYFLRDDDIPGLVNDGGGVYDFPGANQDIVPPTTYNGGHLIQTGQNLLQLISYMSVECWVNLDTFSAGSGALNDRNHLVHVGPQTNLPQAQYNFLWSLTVNSTGHLGGYHEVNIRSPIVTTSATAQLSLNTTHHIVTTRNGLAKTITFWIDGVEYDTVGYSTNYNGGGNQTFFRVGYASADSFSRMNGQIDNIAVYNYELPDARILAHYNSGI